jgi:hypothetical protein
LNQRAALERAEEFDPEFSAAYWESALFWQNQMSVTSIGSELTSDTSEERKEKYEIAIGKAIAFEKDPIRKTRYRADEAGVELRFLESLRLITDYLADRPNDREAIQSRLYTLMYLARWSEAQTVARHLVDIGGDDLDSMQAAITNLVFSNDPAGAATVARQALERHPDNANLAYQAHRALLWDGAIDEARNVLTIITGSQLPWFNKSVSIMRQACAEGRTDDALKIHQEFVDKYHEGEANLWISHHILGQKEQASSVIHPYDVANHMYALSSYLVYPYFDPRPHPNLMALLESQGIKRPPPLEIPFRCHISPETT